MGPTLSLTGWAFPAGRFLGNVSTGYIYASTNLWFADVGPEHALPVTFVYRITSGSFLGIRAGDERAAEPALLTLGQFDALFEDLINSPGDSASSPRPPAASDGSRGGSQATTLAVVASAAAALTLVCLVLAALSLLRRRHQRQTTKAVSSTLLSLLSEARQAFQAAYPTPPAREVSTIPPYVSGNEKLALGGSMPIHLVDGRREDLRLHGVVGRGQFGQIVQVCAFRWWGKRARAQARATGLGGVGAAGDMGGAGRGEEDQHDGGGQDAVSNGAGCHGVR